MPDYSAPLQQMSFTIEHLADFTDVVALQRMRRRRDTVDAVLEEAGRFANGVLAPTNWLGDRKAVQVVDQAVQVPPEFTDAYASSAKAAGRASRRIRTSAARACQRPSRSPATRCGPPPTSRSRCARSCRRARSSRSIATAPRS